MSGMDRIIEIHGKVSKTGSGEYRLTSLARGRFRPCLSSRSSVDGCQRDARRERFVQSCASKVSG